MMSIIYFFLLFGGLSSALYTDPHCSGETRTIVHLFEWKWTDIEKECEYLAKAGYCAVQTSAATEYKFEDGLHSWMDRYEIVSYGLSMNHSRSGTEAEFTKMVATCNQLGVRIITDVILNHMAKGEYGVGIMGTVYNGTSLSYPGLNFTAANFHSINDCSNPQLTNTSSADDIRKCRVQGYPDLDQSQHVVQKKMYELLNKLEQHGVAGFRVGEAKNMDPEDLKAIYDSSHNVNMTGRPVIINEVFNTIPDAVRPEEYYDIGLVTDFRYSQRIGEALTKKDYSKLCDIFKNLVKAENALIFVDSHESQRGLDLSGSTILTYQKPSLYKLAQAFTLASGYGSQRVMSSYTFSYKEEGPPSSVEDNKILDVTIKTDGSCDGGWVCEHRWPLIAGMVKYSNWVGSARRFNCQATPTTVSFMRGDESLFWMTSDANFDYYEVSTELPPAQYCNMLTDCKDKFTVDASRSVIINSSMEGVVALIKDPDQPLVTEPTTEQPTTEALTTTEEPLTTQELTTEKLTTEDLKTTLEITTEELQTTQDLTTEELKTTQELTTEDLLTTRELTTETLPTTQEPTTKELLTTQYVRTDDLLTTPGVTPTDPITRTPEASFTNDGASTANPWTAGGLLTTEGGVNVIVTGSGLFTGDPSVNNQQTTVDPILNQASTAGTGDSQLSTDGSKPNNPLTTIGVITEVVTTLAPTPSGPNWQRTVILVEKQTNPGQDLFLRGGIDSNRVTGGCSGDYESNPCVIPIRHRVLNMTDATPARDAWVMGDNYLDWNGAETGQGKYNNFVAQGTPAQWTTNNPSKKYYDLLNKYGDHYWIVDVDMDCDKSYDGFFEFKGFLSNGWEALSNVNNDCTGDGAVPFPYHDANHIGRCGYVNVYHWGTGQCEIHQLDYVATTTHKQSEVTTPGPSYVSFSTTVAVDSVGTSGVVTEQLPTLQTTPAGPDWRRTVLLVEKQPSDGGHVFFRGGIDQRLLNNTKACETENFEQNPCVVPINHRNLNMTEATPARNAWAVGDNYLDWYGAEGNQGTYEGVVAQGTPGQLTSNNSGSQYYNLINKYGDNYWIVDVDMDCSRTYGGLFEFDGVQSSQWESVSNFGIDCTGDGSLQFPFHDGNHIARCGYVNVYQWGTGKCEIHSFDGDVTSTPDYSSANPDFSTTPDVPTLSEVNEFTTVNIVSTLEFSTEDWLDYNSTIIDTPVGMTLEVPETTTELLATSAAPTVAPQWRRTVILLQKQSDAGEEVFIRGGIDPAHVSDNTTCETKEYEANLCAIPIRHRTLEMANTTPARDTWAKGDNFLDWNGPEFYQEEYNRVIAQGTPGQLTSNNSENHFFNILNKYGDDFWIVDVEMDCSRSNEGFFEFYGVQPPGAEFVTNLTNDCTGDGAVPFPYHGDNHIGRCGYINVYQWEIGQCEIHPFDGPTTTAATTELTTPIDLTWQRTVILLQKPADVGEDVFIRGGINSAFVPDNTSCETKDYENNECAIPIRHRPLGMSTTTPARDTWINGDNYLDWNGPEFYQKEYNRVIAQGTPGQVTSNISTDQFYNILNKYGDDYWIVDVDMNCNKTFNGFFEFYGVQAPGSEAAMNLTNDCVGDGSVPFPYHDTNHIGRCGYINVYHWGTGQCEIHPFQVPTTVVPTTTLPTTPIDLTWQRTVILVQKKADIGEDVFIRGGVDPSHVSDNTTCDTKQYEVNLCAIPIRHRKLAMTNVSPSRNTWIKGDGFLDWFGPEYNQLLYNRVIAQGTPGQLTSNNSANHFYNLLNTYGEDYWIVDVDMECTKTDNGFFEFYAVQAPGSEGTMNLTNDCTGDGAVPFPYHNGNHIGRCGYINVYHWGTGQCEIKSFRSLESGDIEIIG